MARSWISVLIVFALMCCYGVAEGRYSYNQHYNHQGIYYQWGSWGECTKSCGYGMRFRYRNCKDWDNYQCTDVWQTRACQVQLCPVHGKWSSWSAWTPCPVTCGGGKQSRTRTCNYRAPVYGGNSCVGPSRETKECATNQCPPTPPPPIHGNWSAWTPWRPCSTSCGGGIQSRIRTCTNPPPANGGRTCNGVSSEIQRCATHSCPTTIPPSVHGKWTQWSPWGSCSATCGGGSQSRNRSCTNPSPTNGGRYCKGLSTQTQQCATHSCPTTPPPPVHGNWSEWSSWSACTVTCGEGTQSRNRSCTNPAPANGGQNCFGQRSQTQKCAANGCPVNGNWTRWSPWSPCSTTCGGGRQSRTRSCSNPAPANGGQNCVGQRSQTQRCAANACPVNGNWTRWSPWSPCSTTCGGGRQSRNRSCSNPAPANGGQNCVGQRSQTQRCAANACPVNGNWTRWSPWSPCSTTCGGGRQSRNRSCSNPAPANGGQNCVGQRSQTQRCAANGCPVNGNWTRWSPWSPCSTTCGGGKQSRNRSCSNPAPANGGQNCVGQRSQTQRCAANRCPVNGNWTQWSPWSPCSTTCGGGRQSRNRSCSNPAPANGGQNCVGQRSQTQRCAANGCPVNGNWTRWSPWSPCSTTCGGGKQSRNRSCSNPAPANGGQNCVGQRSQTQRCAANGCPLNGNWTQWSPWSPCSTTCGGGRQSRNRSCSNPAPANGGQNCVGQRSQTQRCAANGCPVNGNWTQWSPWSPCSTTCGGGRQSRNRSCSNPAPANGGQNCGGQRSQTQRCAANACPVNGNWTRWSPWSPCSTTCGGGRQSRNRSCSNPAPANGGQNCVGQRSQTQRCAANGCPVNGNWTQWSPWSPCSITCGGGRQSRNRSCSNPAPANGGQNCFGQSSHTQSCAANGCPVNGNWTQWSPWSPCSITCGGGRQSRNRSCSNPAPANGGQNCVGQRSQTQRCAANGCPVNGNWTRWSPWSPCSTTCGGGRQSRNRSCSNPAPANGGRNCVGLSSETQICAKNTCPSPGCQVGQMMTDRCGQRCVCGVDGNLTRCTRIRKEFTSMSTAERELYVQVIKTASTDSRYKSRYDTLLTLHKNIFNGRGIHGRKHFLTWHRWFILQYENLLREVNCSFTVAYWDCTIVAGRPWATGPKDLWYSGSSGLGGNGVRPNLCVDTGPFREGIWQLIPSVNTIPRCLRREFNGKPPNAARLSILLNFPPARFNDFELVLRVSFHDLVHCLINGTMCTLDSASAPEFFLHHAMVDKIWEEWQKKSSFHRSVYFGNLNTTLPETNNLLPRLFLDNTALPGGVRVEYAPANATINNIVMRLRSLSSQALRRIAQISVSPLSRKTAETFGITDDEKARLARLERDFQPLNKNRPILRSPLAVQLGFDPRTL